MTKLILDRCRSIAPELLDANGDFEVLSVQVGLRPSRRGGPRIEMELVEHEDDVSQAPRFICHNYGHHSAGYASDFPPESSILIVSCRFEGSMGIAKAAADMVIRFIGNY